MDRSRARAHEALRPEEAERTTRLVDQLDPSRQPYEVGEHGERPDSADADTHEIDEPGRVHAAEPDIPEISADELLELTRPVLVDVMRIWRAPGSASGAPPARLRSGARGSGPAAFRRRPRARSPRRG